MEHDDTKLGKPWRAKRAANAEGARSEAKPSGDPILEFDLGSELDDLVGR